MAELSPEEVVSVREALSKFYNEGDVSVIPGLFATIDRDGSGSLEASELEPIIAAITGNQLPEGELEAIIKAADSEGNSTIELDEFQNLLNEPAIKALLQVA